MRMPNSAIAGMVWITLSVPRIPSRSRGTRWQRIPSGSAHDDRRAERAEREQDVLAQLVREALGVHRVLAHHREVVEECRRRAPAHVDAQKDSSRNSTRARAAGAGA